MLGKVRVAVVGTGEIATRSRIPAYLSNKHVDLVGLVDVDKRKAEKVAQKFKIGSIFTSIYELLEKQNLDAISICTPPGTHAELALEALNNGIHVFCEKPMALEVKAGKEMARVSRTKGKTLMVSSYRRFVEAFKTARARILKGKLGHVYCIEDVQLTASPLLDWGKSPWYYNPKEGGVLSDFGTHSFDLMNYLYDDFPHAVLSKGSTHLDSPVEEFCVCVLEYSENRIGVGMLSWLSSTNIEHVAINGTVETMYVSPKLSFCMNRVEIPEISLWREASLNLIRLKFPRFPLLRVQQVKDPLQLETDYFVEQVRQNKDFSKNAINALNVLMTIEAAKRAMEEGKRVEINPVTAI